MLKALLFWPGDTAYVKDEVATKTNQTKGELHDSHQGGVMVKSLDTKEYPNAVMGLHMDRY